MYTGVAEQGQVVGLSRPESFLQLRPRAGYISIANYAVMLPQKLIPRVCCFAA